MRKKSGNRAKQLQKPSEQEIFQTIVQQLRWFYFNSPEKARRDFWKRALISLFFAGPFFAGGSIIGLVILGLARFIPVILFINAVCCILPALKFHLYSRNLEKLPPELQARWKDCLSFWSYLLAVWIGFLASVSTLVGIVCFFLAENYSGWELIIAGYVIIELVVWLRRKDFLGAIVRPEAYPWFRPIRLFFAIPLGSWILFTAVANIVIRVFKNKAPNIVFFGFVAGGFVIALLIGGLTLIGGCIVYLYYQRCRGLKELKL